jgi:hypothetical protein
MKNEKSQQMKDLLDAAPEKIVQSETEVISKKYKLFHL